MASGTVDATWNVSDPSHIVGTAMIKYLYRDGRSCELAVRYDATPTMAAEPSGHYTVETKDIEAVGIRLVVSVGIGSSITQEQHPVVLLKDGTACLDSSILASELTLSEHKAAHPNSWTTWSKVNGNFKLAGDSTTLIDHFGASEKGLRLADTYGRMGGGPDPSTSTVIVTQHRYQFLADGQFVQGSFVALGSPSTAVAAAPPDQRGTYEIDGYRLTLRYADGAVAVKSFVAQKPPVKIMYIAGGTFLVEKVPLR